MLRFLRSFTSAGTVRITLSVIAGCLCFMPGGRTAEACGLAKLIREGASVGEVRDWFDFGGSKHAINQSCWRRTPLGEAVLRLDLDILNLLFAKGGDVNAIDSPFLSDDDDSVFVELADGSTV